MCFILTPKKKNFRTCLRHQLLLFAALLSSINLMLLPLYIGPLLLSLDPFYLEENIYIYIYISLPNLLPLRKKSQNIMEEVQDIVIVGAGIAGLTTSLGLHKYPSSLYFYIHVHVCTFWFSLFFFISLFNLFIYSFMFVRTSLS